MSVNIAKPFTSLLCVAAIVMILLMGGNINMHEQFRFAQWTSDDGLPQNTVNSIVQTSDDYLWLTTLDGLVRFDGVCLTVFNKTISNKAIGRTRASTISLEVISMSDRLFGRLCYVLYLKRLNG